MNVNKDLLVKSVFSHELYYLYIRTLIGKFIKKGGKFKALKIYKKIKEGVKLQTNKEKKIFLIFYKAMLNTMSKVSFKEMRMGSQKKQIPIPIFEEKQVLESVATLLAFSKNNKFLQIDKLIELLILSADNKGALIINKKIKYRKAIINKMLLSIFKFKKNKKKLDVENYKYVSEKNYFEIYKNKTTL